MEQLHNDYKNNDGKRLAIILLMSGVALDLHLQELRLLEIVLVLGILRWTRVLRLLLTQFWKKLEIINLMKRKNLIVFLPAFKRLAM